MTAASGIVHEEFHGPDFAKRGGPFEMIQLWVNLPAKDKKADPGYQGITDKEIPRVALPGEAGLVRVIAGSYEGNKGPAHTFSPIDLWDVRVNAGCLVEFKMPAGHTTSVFVLKGRVRLESGESVGEAELGVLDRDGESFALEALADTTLMILSGAPIGEPIVGYGPFVMNTEAEIQQAFLDYRSGRMGRIAAPVAATH